MLLVMTQVQGVNGVPEKISSQEDASSEAAAVSLGAVAALLPPLLLVLGPTKAITLTYAVIQGRCLLAVLRMR